jgi:hypothetical protein
MAPLVTRIASALGRSGAQPVGSCMVCGKPVRESDDRMRVHGLHVHTGCAGYSLRRRGGRSRVRGSRPKRPSFTGD